jgi:hypothetical protein
MSGIAKRLGIEAGWLVAGVGAGAFLWVLVASGYENRTDAYWTMYGHPPPPGTFRSPAHLMPAFVCGPYFASVLTRLVWSGKKLLGPKAIES